tara:strand:- start:1513 stop:3141 length:1629 start_codon:yes stop_codon:yes gene_type:complete
MALDQAQVRSVVALLQASETTDNAMHRHVMATVTQYQQDPQFARYLCYVFSRLATAEVGLAVRHKAGLLLKNTARVGWAQLPPAIQQQIKAELVQQSLVGESARALRNTAGSIITTIVSRGSLAAWPELLPALAQFIGQGSDAAAGDAVRWCALGAMQVFCKMCEDSPLQLDGALRTMVPMLLAFLSHGEVQLRRSAMACFENLVCSDATDGVVPAALLAHAAPFLGALGALTGDPDPVVRRLVCSTIVGLLERKATLLMPSIGSIFEFMLSCTASSKNGAVENEVVALEACSFWAKCTCQDEDLNLRALLRPLLPRLLPTLLDAMIYAADDETVLDADEDDSVADRPQDLKPYFKGARKVTPEEEQEAAEDDASRHASEGEGGLVWNLRKCAAHAVDALCVCYGNALLEILLPLVQMRLNFRPSLAEDPRAGEAWKVRESAILALGCAAEGCYTGLQDHLPALYPFMITMLDPSSECEPVLIRTILCWTLGRFASWIVDKVRVHSLSRCSHNSHGTAHTRSLFSSHLFSFSSRVGPRRCVD